MKGKVKRPVRPELTYPCKGGKVTLKLTKKEEEEKKKIFKKRKNKEL